VVQIETADLISITEANKLGISALVREAESGRDKVLIRNNKPVAALVSMERLDELEQLREDLLDIALATARMLTTSDKRYSLDEVLDMFGYTREQLREMPD
jgi:prevent-host-death family protein